MNLKLFEVRDRATRITCFAFEAGSSEPREAAILRASGFGDFQIMFGRLEGGICHYDMYEHRSGSRTISEAHKYVFDHWDELVSGDVIDVEFILGETTVRKETEL